MGALLVALMNESGLFLLEGKVRTGFTPQSRQGWVLWAEDNLLNEEGQTLWVDPFEEPRVIEIAAEAIVSQEQDTLMYNKHLAYWAYTKNAKTGTLCKPRFVRVVSHQQVPVDDLPSLEPTNSPDSAVELPGLASVSNWLLPPVKAAPEATDLDGK